MHEPKTSQRASEREGEWVRGGVRRKWGQMSKWGICRRLSGTGGSGGLLGVRGGELGSCCSGTKILCMHNLSRIYGWQYCEKEDFPQHSWCVCACGERGWEKGIAGALERPVRRLCVREIKLPNGHYLGAQGLRKLLRLWKLLNYVNTAPFSSFPFICGCEYWKISGPFSSLL